MGLESLLGGFLSPDAKVNAISDTIKDSLENIQAELQCTHSDFVIMIKPTNEQNEFKLFIVKSNHELLKSIAIPGTVVREITLKEIVEGKDEEEQTE